MPNKDTANLQFVNPNYTNSRILPYETRLAMIRECRRIYGISAADGLWKYLGFPAVAHLSALRQLELDFPINDNSSKLSS